MRNVYKNDKLLANLGGKETNFGNIFILNLQVTIYASSELDMFELSAAAASLCVQVKGAMPSMPQRNSVMDLIKSI